MSNFFEVYENFPILQCLVFHKRINSIQFTKKISMVLIRKNLGVQLNASGVILHMYKRKIIWNDTVINSNSCKSVKSPFSLSLLQSQTQIDKCDLGKFAN